LAETAILGQTGRESNSNAVRRAKNIITRWGAISIASLHVIGKHAHQTAAMNRWGSFQPRIEIGAVKNLAVA
jgi:hypothetical protein